jgi:hypothetical protein
VGYFHLILLFITLSFMGWLTTLLLALYAITALPSAYAWTLVWRNATDHSAVEHGSRSQPCKEIDNPQGKRFEWDVEGGSFAISLYGNSDCSGTSAGYATIWQEKNATNSIHSFKVDDTSSTTASKSSLSGGAIAGIVIGVVVGVALIGGLLYVFGRRHQRRHVAAGTGVWHGPPAMLGAGLGPFGGEEKPPRSLKNSSVTPAYNISTAKPAAELPGGDAAVELSAKNEVNELEGKMGSQLR